MFTPEPNLPFSQLEEKILAFWKEQEIFQKTLDDTKDKPDYVFYDGPPFATGLPHYGHLLAGTVKDLIPRYKTMKGYHVPRRFGWDCHGLPVEYEIEKAQQLSGKHAIEEFGIANFNEACRSIVQRYTGEWKSVVERMGRWVDFDNGYRTMDIDFMESVWWVFKSLYEKGLVYEGFKVMPFSPKLGTPLSNFEAGENYKEVDDPAIIAKFPIEGEEKSFFIAWTTTPWTLVSNLALGIGPSLTYVKIYDKQKEEYYYLVEEALERFYSDESLYQKIETVSGDQLIGVHYSPLFPYFKELRERDHFRTIAAEFVDSKSGTGIVHLAPAFGEEDFYACKAAGLSLVCPIDTNGYFTAPVHDLVGTYFKDADSMIIERLKRAGLLYQQGTIHHRYPFCWRSDAPLLYRAITTWFVAVESIKDKILDANSQINWNPSHIKEGRFGKWLEGARDWAVSRNRYWGTPIPIWRADDGSLLVIGSIKELEELAQTTITDLHRHFIDDLVIHKDGKEYRRVPEVFDCWFESGAMPYAQNHYPFENRQTFEENFPADFISEGMDQTRGWFYTLTVLSAALFNKPAFKQVNVNGIILAEDGNKMSKRLKNYPDPMDMVNKYSADALRVYLLHSPVVRGENLRMSEKGIEGIFKQVILPLWSAYNGFFITYAHICKWEPTQPITASFKPKQLIDRWVLAQLNRLIVSVTDALDRYDVAGGIDPLVQFIEQLTNWYIRRSRRRFWSVEASQDRHEAFQTLYLVLYQLSKLLAPFMPFLSEMIYQNLKQPEDPLSIHLTTYPTPIEDWEDSSLVDAIEQIQLICNIGHSLRKEHRYKVRQPLPAIHVICRDPKILESIAPYLNLIEEELNVKSVIMSANEESLVDLIPKPNFRVLGKMVGKQMPLLQQRISELTYKQLYLLESGQPIEIQLEDLSITLTGQELSIERRSKPDLIASSQGALTVLLDTTLTPELIAEGLSREVVNKINLWRRQNEFNITDRIQVVYHAPEELDQAIQAHASYIQEEIQASNLQIVPISETQSTDFVTFEINEHPLICKITLSQMS
jgi:isoleucyl-tRNA synthetase